jgi:hypothetical protein
MPRCRFRTSSIACPWRSAQFSDEASTFPSAGTSMLVVDRHSQGAVAPGERRLWAWLPQAQRFVTENDVPPVLLIPVIRSERGVCQRKVWDLSPSHIQRTMACRGRRTWRTPLQPTLPRLGETCLRSTDHTGDPQEITCRSSNRLLVASTNALKPFAMRRIQSTYRQRISGGRKSGTRFTKRQTVEPS